MKILNKWEMLKRAEASYCSYFYWSLGCTIATKVDIQRFECSVFWIYVEISLTDSTVLSALNLVS